MLASVVRLLLVGLATSATAYITAGGEVVIPGASSYNGLNLVPQMGWNNWNAYHCDVSEELLLKTAEAMVTYGLRDLGYNYVVLDDCWSIGRNESGYLLHNPVKFPSGIKSIADRLHAMNFKFGMYSSAGVFTCGRYPGSLGFEQKDADTFASWGVDYLKYDNCYNQGQSGSPQLSFNRYNVMSKALNNTGRPMVYAMCNWGNDDPYDWAYTIANSYRMSGDIYDSFQRPDSRCPCTETPCNWPGFHCSVMNILNKMAPITSRTQPGAFNDMDMLEVGNGGQSDSEYVLHFSMWAIMSSPLLMGTNIPGLSPAHLSILSNPAVIALNQDVTGTSAVRKWREVITDDVDDDGQGEIALWTRVMNNGDTVIALINAANSSRTMRATAKDIFLDQATAGTYLPAPELSTPYDVYDLWANRMSNDETASVLAGNATIIGANSTSVTRYNATALGYAQGLSQDHPALFGKKVGRLAPGGVWEVQVDRHSVGLFRLRNATQGSRMKDEL